LRTFAQIGLCDAKSACVEARVIAGPDSAPRQRPGTQRRCLRVTGHSQCVAYWSAEIKPFLKTDYSIIAATEKPWRCLIALFDAFHTPPGRGRPQKKIPGLVDSPKNRD